MKLKPFIRRVGVVSCSSSLGSADDNVITIACSVGLFGSLDSMINQDKNNRRNKNNSAKYVFC
eukprot:m.223066 g.223066  ORF g.223066 m.223066 type:complete len:63 (+) comp33389_c1_seq1:2604-2792(+)